MLAVLLVLALLGAAHCDPEPEPEPKTFKKLIHLPAPKVQHVNKPALQEHAVPYVQHVPLQRTIVKQVNVPKPVIQEVPLYVFKDLVLKSPVLRPKVIKVEKTLLKPHIKDVPVEHVRYIKRPYNVVHTRYVKAPFPQYRKVIIPKVKVEHKTLNRIVEVPRLVIRRKIKHIIRPFPVIHKKLVKKPVDVPINVDVPTPVITNRHVTHTRKIPVGVNVIRKVKVPKKVVLKELVPIPVKGHYGGANGYYGDATLGEDIQLARNIAAGGLGAYKGKW